jgi:ribosomal protein L37AE/L43A
MDTQLSGLVCSFFFASLAACLIFVAHSQELTKQSTEDACQKYLAACRWPDGFVCPRCENRRAYELVKLRLWQCSSCRHQVALTAGTILHNAKTPLTVWFWAADLMTTDKRGISPLLCNGSLVLGVTKQHG